MGELVALNKRPRPKSLWRGLVYEDLKTPEAIEMARRFHVAISLLRRIAYVISNLKSFTERGFAWASQAWLASAIKHDNGLTVSERQIRRGMAFFVARGWLRLEHRRGTNNRIFPLHSGPSVQPESKDMSEDMDGRQVRTCMSSTPGHACPPTLNIKPIDKTTNAAAALPDDNTDAATWRRIRKRLCNRLGSDGPAIDATWFSRIEVSEITNTGTVVMKARSRFVANWMNRHWSIRLLRAWQEERPDICSLDIEAPPR